MRESEFQKGDIPQWLECMIEKDWVVDEEVSALALEQMPGMVTTHATENQNNFQKNSRQIGLHGGRYRRPPTCMAASTRANIVSSLYRYDPPVEVALRPGTAALETPDFSLSGPQSSPFHGVVTYTQKAGFFSPCASNIGLPIANRIATRNLYNAGLFGKMNQTWQGLFVKVSHHMCFRPKSAAKGGRSSLARGLAPLSAQRLPCLARGVAHVCQHARS